MFTTLLTPAELHPHLADPQWAIVDCRFDLADPLAGLVQYRKAHLPGAPYADLERDLSGPLTGTNGRHPLPDLDALQTQLGQWGIDAQTQVVAYDQDNGVYAARLWWLLRYLGHRAVAVLDGGFARWVREGYATTPEITTRPARVFHGTPDATLLLTTAAVAQPGHALIDVRAPERYRGDVEPLDPVAGHIPGAANDFYKHNLNADGTFLAPAALRARLEQVLGDRPPEYLGVYCGSGVTASHTLLAFEIAGLPGGKLYAGSWSEWCADPARPVATGNT